MKRRHIQNIVRKEWQVIFSDLNNTLFVSLLPLLIVAQALVYVWLIDRFAGESLLSSAMVESALSKLNDVLPALAGLPPVAKLQVLLLSQFNFFILFIPAMIAMSFSTFSIVEEKMSRSLEPLLATPVKTSELLFGKALSGAIPALLVTWICAAIFIRAVAAMGWGHLLSMVLTPSWFICLFLLTPAVAVLSFLLGVIGSSRAKDPKSAQNMAMVIILPVLGLIAVQVMGLAWFTPLLTLVLTLATALIDILVLRAAVRLFQRESIVIGWR